MTDRTIEAYQSDFAAWSGAKEAFAFWKGRVALYAILRAMSIGADDEVILPGYTCVMDVNPVKYLGGRPVYVDIEPDTFNMNVDLLEEKITSRTKVIIAQHTYGYLCDMDRIMKMAAAHNVTVIEDCCLCVGSTYKGSLAGTFGKASYFSSQWNKPYTTGLGGMVACFDERLGRKIRQLCDKEMVRPSCGEVAMLAAQLAVYRAFIYPRTTAFAQNLFRYLTKKGLVIGSSAGSEFEPQMGPDFFKAVSRLQAAAGIRQLKRLDKNIAHRKKMAALYDRLLSEKGWPARQYDRSVQEPVLVRYPMRIREKQKALDAAASCGIELGSWFESPLHPLRSGLENYDYRDGMCPQAEKACKEVVNLPVHPRTDEKTAERTMDFITRFTPAV